MKLRIFSVFDAAAVSFLPPVFLSTEALLMRQLSELPERQPQHVWVKHPEQFTVFLLGEFDDQSGKLEQVAPEALVNLKVLFSQMRMELPPAKQAEQVFKNGKDADSVMESAS